VAASISRKVNRRLRVLEGDATPGTENTGRARREKTWTRDECGAGPRARLRTVAGGGRRSTASGALARLKRADHGYTDHSPRP